MFSPVAFSQHGFCSSRRGSENAMNRHDVPQQNNSSLATGTGSQHLAQPRPVLPTCLIPPTYFQGTFVPLSRVLGCYSTSRVPTALPLLDGERKHEEKAALEGGITTVLNKTQCTEDSPVQYCSTDFPGLYAFDIQFEEQECPPTKSAPWTYSPSLEKLFVKMKSIVPIRVRLQVFPPVPGCYVRVVVIYKQPEHYGKIVERCPNHFTYDKDGHCAPKHFLRCENTKTSYTSCPKTGRHSLLIPLDAPQAGCDFVTEMFKFMCFSSCQGGVNRRPILVVFTLEYNNVVVGRKAQNVRICACPGRDRTKEETRNANVFQQGIWKEARCFKDPELTGLTSRLQTTVLLARAPGTVNGYMRAFNRWKDFALTRGEFDYFPADPLPVAIYLQFLIESTKSHSSVDAAFYAIKWAHESAGLKSPTDSPLVGRVGDGAKRILGTERVNRKELWPLEVLKEIVNGSDLSDGLVLRNVCLFLLCFSGFFRFDDVSRIRRNQISFHEGFMKIKIERSKNDQLREGNEVLISEAEG